MSIYDDLANSGYMNNQHFRQQFHFDPNDSSLRNSRPSLNFQADFDAKQTPPFDPLFSQPDSIHATPPQFPPAPMPHFDAAQQQFNQFGQPQFGQFEPRKPLGLKERDEVKFDDDEMTYRQGGRPVEVGASQMNLDQFKANNEQLQMLLQQLQGPQLQQNNFNYGQQREFQQENYYPQESYKGASQLNYDNSILQIAQRRAEPPNKSLLQHSDELNQSNNFYSNSSFLAAAGRPPYQGQAEGVPENFYKQSQMMVGQHLATTTDKENEDANVINPRAQAVQNEPGPKFPLEQQQKRREILEQFDRIPIKELNKLSKGEEPEGAQDFFDEQQVRDMPLEERILHPMWKVRTAAYKELAEWLEKYLPQSEEEVNPFEVFGPKMQQIISDPNQIAQYEGLCCLQVYLRISSDIQQLTFQVHRLLFERIQLNKQNFRDVCAKILLLMLKKDRSQTVVPSLLKTFKAKQAKVALFAVQVAHESICKDEAYDVQLLRQTFRACQEILTHPNKEVREASLALLKLIFSLVSDDLESFIGNIKQQLRPVQEKEIRDFLAHTEKCAQPLQLFQPTSLMQNNETIPYRKAKTEVEEKEMSPQKELQKECNDLTLLVPQNFYEVPYLPQINVKKKAMEQFNSELEKLVKAKSTLANKDYSGILNVVAHLLEEKNVLVFAEAIKSVELLMCLMGRLLKPAKLKHFTHLLCEKYKESKSSVVTQINNALSTVLQSGCLPAISLLEYMLLTLAIQNKNPRVKQLTIEKVSSSVKEVSFEDALQLFSSSKDKLVALVQKDPSAGVRDAAVALFVEFKRSLDEQEALNEAISQLPKQRIAEIQKRTAQRPANEPIQQQQQAKKPMKSCGDSKEIVVSVQKLIKGGANCNYEEAFQRWEEILGSMGEEAVKQAKGEVIGDIVNAVNKGLGLLGQKQEVLYMLANLVKMLYAIDRSLLIDSNSRCPELHHCLSLANSIYFFTVDHKLASSLYNLLFALSSSQHISLFFCALKDSIYRLSSLETEMLLVAPDFEETRLAQVIQFIFGWVQDKIPAFFGKGLQPSQFEELRSIGLSYLNRDSESAKQLIIQSMVQFKEGLQRVLSPERRQQMLLQQQQEEGRQKEVPRETELKVEEQLDKKSKTEVVLEMIDSEFEKGMQMIKGLSTEQEFNDIQNKELLVKKLLQFISPSKKTQSSQYNQAYCLKALLWLKGEVFGVEDCFKLAPLILCEYSKFYSTANDADCDCSVELYLLNSWVKEFSLRDLVDRLACVTKEASTPPEKFQFLFSWLWAERVEGGAWAIEDFRKLALGLAANVSCCLKVKDFFVQAVGKEGERKVREFMEIQLMHSQNVYNRFMDWFAKKFPQEEEEEEEEKVEEKFIAKKYQQENYAKDLKENQYQEEEEKEEEEAQVEDQDDKYENNQKDEKESDEEKEESDSEHDPEQRPVSSSFQPPSSHLQLPSIGQLDKGSWQQSKRQQQDSELYEALQVKNDCESGLPSARGQQSSALQSHMPSYHEMRQKRKQKPAAAQQQEESSTAKYENILSRLEKELKPQSQASSKADRRLRYEEQKPAEEDMSTFRDELSQLNTKQKEFVRAGLFDEEEVKDRLQASQIKEDRFREEKEQLEREKQRLDEEKRRLLKDKDHETEEWKGKFQEMAREHGEVVQRLGEANECYLKQVGENEQLREQLDRMQRQHIEMMKRFENIESKLGSGNPTQEKKQEELRGQKAVKEVFREDGDFQLSKGNESQEQAIKKVQDLLLTTDRRDSAKDLGDSLVVFYSSMKHRSSRLNLIQSISTALSNEDVLFALPLDAYNAILGVLLRIFAQEKAQAEVKEVGEATAEVQKVMSRLLNSKEFTTSLVSLIQTLREALPEDFFEELSPEMVQFLRVLMRCISRITKALHSENPNLVRSFDVLVEMQRLFKKHPPESLQQGMPSLAEFDFVYRTLKDLSDKLMELQPLKVKSFLEYVDGSHADSEIRNENVFVKYMKQAIQSRCDDYDDYEEDCE